MDNPVKIIREEIKWVLIISMFASSVLINYFTVSKTLEMTVYRVTNIEEARAVIWEKHDIAANENTKKLESIGKDIAVIKKVLETTP